MPMTIVVEEMKSSGWYYKIWQSFAVLLPDGVLVSWGRKDLRLTIACARGSQDGMTADWVSAYDLLEKLATRIITKSKV